MGPGCINFLKDDPQFVGLIMAAPFTTPKLSLPFTAPKLPLPFTTLKVSLVVERAFMELLTSLTVVSSTYPKTGHGVIPLLVVLIL